jgi:ribonuclease D
MLILVAGPFMNIVIAILLMFAIVISAPVLHSTVIANFLEGSTSNSEGGLMVDDKIVKVGAAIHDDILGLQRKHDFTPAQFVDLQKIVWEWGIRDKSVKKMAAIILGFRVSKTQQLSNWEAESLSDAQCRYAATDAWACLQIHEEVTRLKRDKNYILELSSPTNNEV